MSTFAATFGYEARMQLRRPAFWIGAAAFLALLELTGHALWGDLLHEDPRTSMVRFAINTNTLLAVWYAYLLADRLARDDWLEVAALLDAAPASPTARLLGKYAGCCVVTALPITVANLGFAAVYVLRNHAPAALSWALAVLGSVTVPALLFAGALALVGPLVMPTPVFRVLFIAYWVWTSYYVPPVAVPTLTQTVVYPTGGYPIDVFFSYHGRHSGSDRWAGPEPGALLNVLRPEPNVATACLSVATLLVLAAVALASARLLRAHRAR
jgi:ABC-2 type transport system permease protein